MGTVIIQDYTTKEPLQMIGKEAGCCWGADTTDSMKNLKRGIECVLSEHGRTWEFPQIYMEMKDYSARVMREFYTHIGGSPTRLQSSTRYIDYEKGFNYVVPSTISSNKEAVEIYRTTMNLITTGMQNLEKFGIPREDCAMLLPLGMTTEVVCRTNFRNLADMSHQRMCTRVYSEFRILFYDISKALSEYSDEWKWLVEECFMAKCEFFGGLCNEKKSCGRFPQPTTKPTADQIIKKFFNSKTK